MRRLPLAVAFLAMLLVAVPSFAPGPTLLQGGVATARKVVSSVACPGKIGRFKNEQTRLGVGEDSLQCFYNVPRGLKNAARVRVAVNWNQDVPGERARCVTRSGEPDDGTAGGPEDFNRTIHSRDRNARVTYYHEPGKGVTRSQAEQAALRMLAAAAPLAHPCLPYEDARAEAEAQAEAAAAATEPLAPACPLIIGDRFVRGDWYDGDPPPAVTTREGSSPSSSIHGLRCTYRPAYQDEGDTSGLSLTWMEGDIADVASWDCQATRRDDISSFRITSGTFPVSLSIPKAFLEAGGERFGDTLIAAAGRRTQVCPGATRPEPLDTGGATVPGGGEAGAVADDPYDEAVEAYIGTHDAFIDELDAALEMADAADAAEERGATTEEVVRLYTNALAAQAGAIEAYAGRLETAPFPEAVAPLVAAYVAALREDARLLRDQARLLPEGGDDAEAAFAALLDASDRATTASIEARAALNEAMGVAVEEDPAEDA